MTLNIVMSSKGVVRAGKGVVRAPVRKFGKGSKKKKLSGKFPYSLVTLIVMTYGAATQKVKNVAFTCTIDEISMIYTA